MFDVAELTELPDVSCTDLLKAATRLRDGDLSGALGAACAAVDSATNAVYADHGLGVPSKDSFQTRCMKALDAKKAISRLPGELTGMGWNTADAKLVLEQSAGRPEPGCLRHASAPFENERRPRFQTRAQPPGLRRSKVGGAHNTHVEIVRVGSAEAFVGDLDSRPVPDRTTLTGFDRSVLTKRAAPR